MNSILSKLASISQHILKLAGAYDPNEDYTGTYMLAFYLDDDFGIPHCHVTHKYLDEQDDESVKKIIETVDQYFKDHPSEQTTPREWTFDQFEMFGAEHDTPVLRCMENADMLLPLKARLEQFREDDFPVYKPHVTLADANSVKAITATPVKYALVSGDNEIKSWPLG